MFVLLCSKTFDSKKTPDFEIKSFKELLSIWEMFFRKLSNWGLYFARFESSLT